MPDNADLRHYEAGRALARACRQMNDNMNEMARGFRDEADGNAGPTVGAMKNFNHGAARAWDLLRVELQARGIIMAVPDPRVGPEAHLGHVQHALDQFGEAREGEAPRTSPRPVAEAVSLLAAIEEDLDGVCMPGDSSPRVTLLRVLADRLGLSKENDALGALVEPYRKSGDTKEEALARVLREFSRLRACVHDLKLQLAHIATTLPDQL